MGCQPGFIEYGKPGRGQDVISSLDFLGRGLPQKGVNPSPKDGLQSIHLGPLAGPKEGEFLWGVACGGGSSPSLGPWTSVCSEGGSRSLEHWKTSRVGSVPRLRLQGVGPSAGERGLPPVSRGCCLLSGEAWDLKGGLTVTESQGQRWRNLAAGTPQCSEKLRSPPVREPHGSSQSCLQQTHSGPNWAEAAIGVSRPNGSS